MNKIKLFFLKVFSKTTLKKIIAFFDYLVKIFISGLGFGSLTILLILIKWWNWYDVSYEWIFRSLIISSYLMFVILYPFRKISFIRNNKPFWWYFGDDNDIYGTATWRIQKGLEYGKFWTAWLWNAIRNPMWNLKASLIRKIGVAIAVYVKGLLTKNGIEIPFIVGKELPKIDVAGLKYVNENGDYTDNTGKYISLKYSVLGWLFLWFAVDDRLYWRFSLAKRIIKVKFNFYKLNISLKPFKIKIIKHLYDWQIWCEIHTGITYRYTLRLKFKNKKLYEDVK